MVIRIMPQESDSSSTTSTTMPASTTTTVPPVKPDPNQTPTLPSLITKPSYAGGVDPDWKAPDQSVFNNRTTPYLYKSNDWQILLKIPKNSILGVQNKLMQAFPGWKPGVLGRANDDKTISKFKDLLGYINTDEALRGSDYMKALEYFAKNPLEIPAASQKAAVRLTSPIDLRKPFERGAQATIGQILAPKQTKKMEEEFAQMETQYQRGAATGAGGAVIQPPDPTAFAEETARKLRPTAAKATEYSDYMGVLSQLLQG